MNRPVQPESRVAPSSGVLDHVARHRGTPWLVLAFSVATCLAGWYHGDRASRRHAEERFLLQADEATQALQGRLTHYEDALRGAAAFARSVPDVDRARWRDYVRGAGLASSTSGLAGLGFTPRVAHDALAAHRSRLRRDGFPGYEVWPASTRPEHFPAGYVEPESDGYQQTVGFDLASDPVPLAAVERARESGAAVLSSAARLHRDARDAGAPAFALLLPVYAAGAPLDTVEQRRAALIGVVHAAFRLPDVLAAALAPPHRALGLSLREGGPEGTVLHRLPRPDGPDAAAVFQAARPITVGGQRWSVVVEAGPAAVSPEERLRPALAAAGALLTNGVLAGLLFAQRRVRRRAEAFAAEQSVALHRSEGAFLAVAESARVAIVTTDAQGRFTYANAAAEQMLGASRDQLRGVNSAQYIADVDRTRFTEGFRRFLAGHGRIAAGAPTSITGRRQSGEEFPAEISLSWFEAPDDGPYITGVIVDLTERRRAEETLRFAREQAEQAARSKSDFLAMMSHELRTPMNGVLGMTNLLSSTTLDDEQREYLDMIGRSGSALLRLIDDILDFSKIEAGRVVLEQMPCDVGEIARDVITLLGVQAHTRGLRLDSHVAVGTPTAIITDPGRVRQVLFNLVGNAIKFTEAGAVHVTVACDRVDAGRATLRVTVSDTGIGIPEDSQRRLFEKFTQADASTTRRFGGTGLGLAISKGLVESLGGTIGVSSDVGVGSRFWFTFVAPVSAMALSDSTAILSEDLDAIAPAPSALAGRRILVAEDNPVNQRVAVRMLEKLGYVADVAIDGREAVRMAQSTPYAAILMDCHMPDVDGYEASRRISQVMPAGRRPPIVAMTAAGADGERERCLAAGMSDYLAKPVRMDHLRAMLDRWTAPGVP